MQLSKSDDAFYAVNQNKLIKVNSDGSTEDAAVLSDKAVITQFDAETGLILYLELTGGEESSNSFICNIADIYKVTEVPADFESCYFQNGRLIVRGSRVYPGDEGSCNLLESKTLLTAYDENGDVLATGDQMMNKIQPGETQTFASILDCNGQKPDKVEFDIDSGEEMSPADDAIKSSDLEISGTNERNDEYGETSITGNIKNNAAIDTESVAVTVLFKKDGKIVSGSTDFVDNLGAGKEKAFEIIEYDVPEHDSYEVLGLDWGF